MSVLKRSMTMNLNLSLGHHLDWLSTRSSSSNSQLSKLLQLLLKLSACLQCCDTVGWATGRASGLQKKMNVAMLVVVI